MTDDAFTIRKADWFADRDRLRLVRETVFVQEQKVPLELERDTADPQALHLLAESADGRPIGTARLLPGGHIGRMAVLRKWRGRGVGSALLRELLRLNAGPCHLNAQTSAVAFYRRHGFVEEGAEFMDAGIPHRRMTHP
jgi:predicted GNAT family N-acyltransferase